MDVASDSGAADRCRSLSRVNVWLSADTAYL